MVAPAKRVYVSYIVVGLFCIVLLAIAFMYAPRKPLRPILRQRTVPKARRVPDRETAPDKPLLVVPYSEYMAAAAKQVRQGNLQAALAIYRETQQMADSSELRAHLSDLYKLMAMRAMDKSEARELLTKAETVMEKAPGQPITAAEVPARVGHSYKLRAVQTKDRARRRELLAKANALLSTPASEVMLADAEKPEFIPVPPAPVKPTPPPVAAVPAKPEPRVVTPAPPLPAPTSPVPTTPTGRLELLTQVSAARRQAKDALGDRKYPEAVAAYGRAIQLASQIRPPDGTLLETLTRERTRVEARRDYDALSDTWSRAAKAGLWKDALEALRKMEQVGAGLTPRPEGYRFLAKNIREAEARFRSQEYVRLVAEARAAQRQDDIPRALDITAAARKFADDPKDLAPLFAELNSRKHELVSYLGTLASRDAALKRGDLGAARAAGRDAVHVGRRCTPPPANLARSERELRDIERQCDEACVKLIKIGDAAREDGDFTEAIRSYEQARLLATNPREVDTRLAVARKQMFVDTRVPRDARDGTRRYRRYLRLGAHAEGLDQLDAAVEEYKKAARVAKDPTEAEACIARALARKEALVPYREAAERARRMDRTAIQLSLAHRPRIRPGMQMDENKDQLKMVHAWEEAVRLGDAIKPPPRDLPGLKKALAVRREILALSHEQQLRRKLELAAQAEAAGDLDRAVKLYMEAREYTNRKGSLDENIARIKAKAKALDEYADAVTAAQKASDEAPLRQRALLWQSVYKIGQSLTPVPQDFARHVRTYSELEAQRKREMDAALAKAAALAKNKQFDAALKDLGQARSLALDPAFVDARILETQALAKRHTEAQQAAQWVAQAVEHEQSGDLRAAIGLYHKALTRAEKPEVVRERIVTLEARVKALGRYRAAKAEADRIDPEADIVAALKPYQRVVEVGDALKPPPPDLEKYRKTAAYLERRRAMMFDQIMARARAAEKRSRFGHAATQYRAAREWAPEPDRDLDTRVNLLEAAARGDELAAAEKWPEAVAAYESAMNFALQMRAMPESMAPVSERLSAARKKLAVPLAAQPEAKDDAEYRRLMEAAAEAEKHERLSPALLHYAAARKLVKNPSEIDARLAAVARRATALKAYRLAVDRATEHLREERFGKAIAGYREAVRLGAAMAPPPGDIDVTRGTIRAAEGLRDARVRELVAKAQKLRDRSLPEDAMKALRKAQAIAADPKSLDPQIAALRKEIARREKDRAAETIRQKQLKQLGSTVALADEFVSQGRTQTAISLYETSIALAEHMRPRPTILPAIRAKLARVKGKLPLLATTANSIGMRFVLIKPGRFLMGRNDGEPDEGPQHPVEITRPLYLSAHQTTNAHYLLFMAATGHAAPRPVDGETVWTDRSFPPEYADHPVAGVSYEDAKAFCRWLSAKEEKTYRLPTEAEWEYACRAGTFETYYWGPKASTAQVNYRDAGRMKTAPTGAYPPNPWGLYEMLGNVSDWCEDYLGQYSPLAQTDPQGPRTGRLRVLRGGWYRSRAEEVTCSSRRGAAPSVGYAGSGLRVVLAPPEGGPSGND